MTKIVALVLLSGAACAHVSVAVGQTELAAIEPATSAASVSVDLATSPAVPKGKSTILGGEIRNVDPVRDQLTLRVFGQHPVKVLFDGRTQVYRDGKRISLLNLGPVGHASVQTVLDGTNVYALSIHMLSHLPEGEYQGHVLSFDSETRQLTLSGALSRQPFKVLVPVSTPVVRQGQDQFTAHQSGESDLVKGALLSVEFESGKPGQGVASQIAVLATPGSAFIFTGNISSLDMHAGSFTINDPKDDRDYQVFFDASALPANTTLREGDHIRVTANFDSGRYVASSLTVR